MIDNEREVSMRVGGDGWKLTRGIDGGFLIDVPGWLDERQVLTLANTLLSEIEMDQRGDSGPWDDDPDYPSSDWRDEVASDSTRRGYVQWVNAQREDDALHPAYGDCEVCHGARTIAVAGPDENGQYDTEDCPICTTERK